MMKEYDLECPCCGQKIKCYLKPNGKFVIRFFDIYDNSEVFKIANENNIELGIYSIRGKEDNNG